MLFSGGMMKKKLIFWQDRTSWIRWSSHSVAQLPCIAQVCPLKEEKKFQTSGGQKKSNRLEDVIESVAVIAVEICVWRTQDAAVFNVPLSRDSPVDGVGLCLFPFQWCMSSGSLLEYLDKCDFNEQPNKWSWFIHVHVFLFLFFCILNQ